MLLRKTAITVFAVIIGFIVAARLGGCSLYYAWKHGGYYKLQNFAPYIHNDAVVVLASGVYRASGKLYFIEKQGDNFALTQKLDLAPYLKGRTPRKLAFNERYLVATAFKGALAFDEFYGEGEKSRASLLVFKKNDDGRWEFLCDFKPSDVNLNSARLVLTERDQIIANDPHYLENGFHGVLLVYEIDAENRSLTLAQEITSDEPRDPGYAALKGRRFFDGFGDSFFYAADLLVVRHCRSPLLSDISAKSTDWSVYRWNGSRWAYETSLLKLLPQSVYDAPRTNAEKKGVPFYFLSGAATIDASARSITLIEEMYDERLFYRFVKDENDVWRFEESEVFCTSEEYDKSPLDKRLKMATSCFQTPEEFSMRLLEEPDWLIGVCPPSTDGKRTLREPFWTVAGFDQETWRLGGDDPRLNWHYPPWFKQANPYARSVLAGRYLASAYVFQNCYYSDHPLHKARVWGGVYIYELDPETGPKKRFSLTTRNYEELTPVPVAE